jgi:hypothetical protein
MEYSHPRKRPRPVVSCLRCRHKKLKCDRTSPCENCTKASIGDTCTYSRDGHVPEKEVALVAIPSTASYPIEDLRRRMAIVEGLLGVRSKPFDIAANSVAPSQVLGTVVVKGNRSIYHGQSDRTTLLNQVRVVL